MTKVEARVFFVMAVLGFVLAFTPMYILQQLLACFFIASFCTLLYVTFYIGFIKK